MVKGLNGVVKIVADDALPPDLVKLVVGQTATIFRLRYTQDGVAIQAAPVATWPER